MATCSASDPPTIWWHGSPYEIPLGEHLVPGRELDRTARYHSGRNRSVFISDHRDCAIAMGSTMGCDLGNIDGAEITRFAMFLYVVEPIGIYPKDDQRAPHIHMLGNERQCERALIVTRYRCLNPTEMVTPPQQAVAARYTPMDKR